MGNPKQKWTAEEEEALRAGIAKHGPGKWKNIQLDPEFHPYLSTRSNIDLKDKWRNMSVGPGEKSRTPKPKTATADSAVATSQPISQVASAPALPAAAAVSAPAVAAGAPPSTTDVTMDEAAKPIMVDVKISSKYDPMIFEAITALNCNETTIVDTSAIIGFIEQRHELPHNGRKQVTSRLRRLVITEKVEKVQNSYRFKESKPSVGKAASPKNEVQQPKELQRFGNANPIETLEEEALADAYRIVEAENKAFLAYEAVKEMERLSILREETESILSISQQIYDTCMEAGRDSNIYVRFEFDRAGR
ncbi:Telomere repeat-binding factor 5 [Linum perenne]